MPSFEEKPNGLTTNAPFGNTFTPVVRTRIVAGKPVYVLERNKPDGDSPTSPTEADHEKKPSWEQTHKVLPPISPRSSPPQSGNSPLASHGSGSRKAPPTQGSLSPASSGWNAELGRAAAAPPEPLRNSQQRLPQYDHHAQEALTSAGGLDFGGDLRQQAEDGYDAYKTKATSYLPSYPLTLERKEELRLLGRIKESMRGYEMVGLKDIYTELTGFDKQLTGWVSLSDFTFTLLRFKLYLDNEDIRMAASMFVSREHPGKVNYEKLLSYIASAKRHEDSHEEPALSNSSSRADSSKYFESKAYNNSIYAEPGPSIMASGAKGKLMKMVEDQLLSAEEEFDLNQLHQEFSLADRLHRQALSHQEIKEICYRMRLPLQESIINLVLQRCRNLGDGQYSWEDFYKFLESVRPIHTGLVLPRSKRPLEMAKVPAQPKSNWPKAEIESPRASISPGQITPLKPDTPKEVPVTLPPPRSDSRTLRGFTDSNNGEPWFQKFSKLAEALYRNDFDRSGALIQSEATWLVNEYNNIFKLGVPEHVIADCVIKNSTGNKTRIDDLLKALLASSKY